VFDYTFATEHLKHFNPNSIFSNTVICFLKNTLLQGRGLKRFKLKNTPSTAQFSPLHLVTSGL